MRESPGRRGRPSRQQAELKHIQLLTLARESFLTNGFSATTIDQIAATSGTSKSTIYAHFGGKEALFRAVAKRSCQVPADALAKVITQGRQPREVIADFVHALINESRDPDSLALLRLAIFESQRFPDIAQAIYQASLETLEPLRNYLKDLQRSGNLGALDIEAAAQDLVSLCTGGYRFLLLSDHAEDVDADSERILSLFLYSIGIRPEGPSHGI